MSQRRERDLALFGTPCGVAQGFGNVFLLEVWLVGEEFLHRAPCADLSDDRADRHPQPANAWLAAHHRGILRNA